MNLLIILLGCNIFQILQDRLDAMFKFTSNTDLLVSMYDKLNITLFLSGGIKNKYNGAESEASLMRNLIGSYVNLKLVNNNLNQYGQQDYEKNYKSNLIQWNFVLDEESTNTAENFVRASKFLNLSSLVYNDVYVVTSEFHKPRAKSMLDLVDNSREYKWILGKYSQPDSEYWESIHIQNIYQDINKAKKSIGIE